MIVATGIKDIMPDIKGFAACWGISVIHCPYCHGYEVRGLKTGLLANDERAFHLSGMINNLTDDLIVLTNGKPDFDTGQLTTLENNGISIEDGTIDEIIHENGHVKSVLFKEGTTRDFEAIYG